MPGPAPSPHAGLLSPSQVHGASEEPGQFSLTNTAGTHTTSEGISSPAPGELVFSSFHSLLAGPYFWSLPSRFRGDKVGRGAGKRKGILGGRDGTGRQRLGNKSVRVPSEQRGKAWPEQWRGLH